MAEIDQILDKVNQIEKERLEENGFTNFVGNVYNKVANNKSFADSNAERAQKALDNQQNADKALATQYDSLIKVAPYVEKIVKAKNPNATKAEDYTNVLTEISNGNLLKDPTFQNNKEIITMAKNVRSMLNNSSKGKDSLNSLLVSILNKIGTVDQNGLAKAIEKAKSSLAGAQANDQSSQASNSDSQRQATIQAYQNQKQQPGQNPNIVTQKDINALQKNKKAIIDSLTSAGLSNNAANRMIKAILSQNPGNVNG